MGYCNQKCRTEIRSKLINNPQLWNSLSEIVLHPNIGGKQPINISQKHWQLLNVAMEIIPIHTWEKLAKENNKVIQLPKSLTDSNLPHIGYVHPSESYGTYLQKL